MIRRVAKAALRILDSRLKTNLESHAVAFVAAWYRSPVLNFLRRNFEFARVRWKYLVGVCSSNNIKLHLGCGGVHFDGYVNIDWRKTIATDLVCDIRKLPYPDKSVETIETYHVIEHLPRCDVARALREWYRVLKPNGKLIIECPDFDYNVRAYLKGGDSTMQLYYVYGRHRFPGDVHYWGYNFRRLEKLLKECQYTDIRKQNAQDNHSEEGGCLRAECRRPAREPACLYAQDASRNGFASSERDL